MWIKTKIQTKLIIRWVKAVWRTKFQYGWVFLQWNSIPWIVHIYWNLFQIVYRNSDEIQFTPQSFIQSNLSVYRSFPMEIFTIEIVQVTIEITCNALNRPQPNIYYMLPGNAIVIDFDTPLIDIRSSYFNIYFVEKRNNL